MKNKTRYFVKNPFKNILYEQNYLYSTHNTPRIYRKVGIGVP